MGLWRILCTAALLPHVLAAPSGQVPLQEEWEVEEHVDKARPLHGRFLHITDFHPDRFYKVYTSTAEDSACHRGQGPAGIYGAETSECDSPIELVNKTMQWVKKELKDTVDFVVWTGDSARHDNDDDIPRTAKQVTELNKLMVRKMFEVFGKHNGDEDDDDPNNDYVVPIIPTFGNNDILPHNILRKGPNQWTREYSKIWRQFIPEAQKHQFEQGGWFYVEVVPKKLAVFSLNTLYFFNSNAAVDGCAVHSEPGYEQMEWLRIQLQFMRERGMKAILTGHVPPARTGTKTNWDETCWQKYTLWLRQYRDVVVGSLYGHFNFDHFILQDFKDLKKGTKRGKMPNYEVHMSEDDDLFASLSSNYFLDLRKTWSKLPDPPKSLRWLENTQNSSADSADGAMSILKGGKKRKDSEKKFLKKIGGEFAERFSASLVGASVVPNLFPTLRVFEYNITGLDQTSDDPEGIPHISTAPPHWIDDEDEDEDDSDDDDDGDEERIMKKRKRYKFDIPQPPSKSAPPGPAYSPQTFSLVRYTQYFANLTHINNDFSASSMEDNVEDDDPLRAEKWKEGKHKGKKPHNKDHEPDPRKFKFEIHYDTREDGVYHLKDLTMPNLVDLARRIGDFIPESTSDAASAGESDVSSDKKKDKKKGKHGSHKKKEKKKRKHRKQNEAWYTFIRRAFVETLDPKDIERDFAE